MRGPNSVRSMSSEAGASRFAFGTCSYGLPFHSTVGITGMTRSRRDLRGADGVGHARDDLEAGPEPGGARAGEGVQAEVEDLLDVPREEDRHVEAREERLRGARDASRTCSPGRRRPPPARRRCAGRRRSCRGEASRRRGRGRAPCRTTWPSTPSYLEPGSWPASWLPQADVAPSSSFSPGTWRTWCSSTSSRLRASSLSRPPSGEPW